MAKRSQLNRRAFLGGAGGVIVGLPLLEVMDRKEARASTGPHRYVVAFAGVSLFKSAVPTSTGASYTMTPAFASLEPLRDKLMLVSGLGIPAAGAEGEPNNIPLGGRPAGPFHNLTVEPILTGMRSGLGPLLSSPTSDQLIADQLAGATPIHSLQLRVQAEAYVGGYGNMSAKKDGSGATPLPPIANPLVAYETLFGNFTPSTPTVSGQTLAQRRSVLDIVSSRAERLLPKVSAADRIRLEQHFEEIRALEKKLEDTMQPAGPGCAAPASPTVPGPGSAYSGENERGKILSDLLHMAFVCDLTRVSSFMISFAQSQMSAGPLIGQDYACHELTHSVAQDELGNTAGPAAWAAMNAWHVEQLAYLAQKLEDTTEDDETLLDRTALALLFEAGTQSSHSTGNMCVAVLGRGDRLRLGEHIVASGSRPCHVLQTLMEINDVVAPFGEVPGTISDMLV
ncbi:MAG: DUF1552 domain-containing protein [Polyangiaceae bacterium]|nr:DUF1552 domain-containing protein [Polyangiaceae bacterium]